MNMIFFKKREIIGNIYVQAFINDYLERIKVYEHFDLIQKLMFYEWTAYNKKKFFMLAHKEIIKSKKPWETDTCFLLIDKEKFLKYRSKRPI
jgi:hypothetical protein